MDKTDTVIALKELMFLVRFYDNIYIKYVLVYKHFMLYTYMYTIYFTDIHTYIHIDIHTEMIIVYRVINSYPRYQA